MIYWISGNNAAKLSGHKIMTSLFVTPAGGFCWRSRLVLWALTVNLQSVISHEAHYLALKWNSCLDFTLNPLPC